MKMTCVSGSSQISTNSARRKCCWLQTDRWYGLSAAMLIMGCSGLTYTYAVYSDHLKLKFHYTQEQIDTIGAAKDFGAVLGVFSGILYNFYPPWVTVFIGAVMHLFGYGLMWVTTIGETASIWLLSLYVAVGTGGDSFVDTACMMTSLQNFGDYRGTAMGILKSQLGLSGAMFVNIYNAFLQPDVERFILLVTVVPTILYMMTSYFVRPSTKNEKDEESEDTSLIFKIIYCITLLLAGFLALTVVIQAKFHAGRSVKVFFSAIMLLIVFVLYIVPASGRYFISRVAFSSTAKSHSQEINLVSIPTTVSNHKRYLEGMSETHSRDHMSEMVSLNDDRIESLEPEQVETELGIGQSDLHTIDILTIWDCLLALDFSLLNFVVVTGAGSGLAIINNFAQIGIASGNEDTSLFVGVLSVGSCLGRLTSGYVSDYLLRRGYSRPLCLLGTQVIMTISCLLLATGGAFFLYIGSAIIGMAYGAYWTLAPAVVSELFGLTHFATLYKVFGICPTLGAYILSAKVLGALYDEQALLYQKSTKENVGDTLCYGQQCFGFALISLSMICFIGVLACLWLFRRTHRIYSRKYHLMSSAVN